MLDKIDREVYDRAREAFERYMRAHDEVKALYTEQGSCS